MRQRFTCEMVTNASNAVRMGIDYHCEYCLAEEERGGPAKSRPEDTITPLCCRLLFLLFLLLRLSQLLLQLLDRSFGALLRIVEVGTLNQFF